MNIDETLTVRTTGCACGKDHKNPIKNIIVGSGAINSLPDAISGYGVKKAYVLSDKNTYAAAAERVCSILRAAGINVLSYSIDEDMPEPDEKTVGSAIMHYSFDCDIVIAVGSGVINDTGKIVSAVSDKPYVIVGTAPSMDGYASATSSMTRDGLKISLPSKSADIIIGDTDILKNAPMHMLVSGLGDMLAKYISICEWRIANIVTGEYYCEEIASLVRLALKKCVDNARGLINRDEKAVEAVFEGLVIGGIAMTYAGVSRPASGVEHYFSHVWDMRGVEFGEKVELHGIQCAVGTLIAAKYYEKLKSITPDREKAIAYAERFDLDVWNEKLTEFLGKGAKSMIELEKKEGKYNKVAHEKRIDIIIKNWDRILRVIDEEIPSVKELDSLFDLIGAPKSPDEIGIDPKILPMTFKATKDIRDKYVLSRLCWDLGIIDEITE